MRLFKLGEKRGVVAFICQGAGLGLVFLAQIALARTLGAASYGVFAYVNAWLVALGVVARFGLDTVVLRDAGIHVSNQDWPHLRGLLRLSGRWVFSVGTVVGFILVAGVLVLVPAEQSELRFTFIVGALLLPVQGLSAIRASTLLALGRIWGGLVPDYLIRPFVLGLSTLAMAAVIPQVNAVGAITASILAAGVALLCGQLTLNRAMPHVRAAAVRLPEHSGFLASAWTLMLFNGSNQFVYQIDTIVVGLMIHPHLAGKYYAAKQLALVASLALIALQTTFAPSFAAMQAKGDLLGLQGLLRKVALGGTLFSLFYVVFSAVFGKFVLGLFGPEFVDAYPVLVILAVGQLCAAIGGPIGQLVAMAGLQTIGGTIYLVSAVIFVALAKFVVPIYGVVGAAVTGVCITCAWIVVLNVIVWRRLNVMAALVPIRATRGAV